MQDKLLDITMSREPKKLSIDIYRKSTYTDIIIPKDSCHPKEHKLAAIRYFYNRMNMYQLSSVNLLKENNTIQQILHNNGFDTSITKNLHGKKKREKDNKKYNGQNLPTLGKRPEPLRKLSRIPM